VWREIGNSRALAALSGEALDELIAQCVAETADRLLATLPSARIKASGSGDLQLDLWSESRRPQAWVRECRRATRLVRALCDLERQRAPFEVEATEAEALLTLAGASLRLRMDRLDRLESGGRAILDYKTGRRMPANWFAERPSHPQLLAYLAALGEDIQAMATVCVNAREVRFDGIAITAGLLPKVKGVPGSAQRHATDAWRECRREWQRVVDRLAADFLAGHATVDPKPGACDYCHAIGLCRIAETAPAADQDDE
jgi:RecB family exonuclease